MNRLSVPLFDCRPQYENLRVEHDSAVARVLQSGWYLSGDETRNFESSFADFCGVGHAVGVGNGTDALELALRAVGCEAGDEVVMAANAGMYAAAAAIQVGATPVFADVDAASLLISADSVARMLSDRTRAVVVTHLFGQVMDMTPLRRVIGSQPVHLIEDGAQAHGAQDSTGRRVGSLGHLATFSFYPTKNLGAFGDAGAVVTDDSALAQVVRELAQYGWSKKYEARRPRGRNSRMDEVQAAVLSVRLPCLDAWNRRRREIVARYTAACSNTAVNFVSSASHSNACHLCVIRHPRRKTFRATLCEAGIASDVHYPLLDVQQPAVAEAGCRSDILTESLAAQGEIVSLPCFPGLNENQVDHVCHILGNLD
ncbi:MAG: DegT/DnrJ/EryC1/StrS family aminotransferase [Fuerstiella sp.]|nr:DegT/DnrJ/EryC1/StrS family aminotransferase [Fuerstiella sp.]